MNYIGSKAKLLPFLKTTIRDVAGIDLSQKVFCDLFGGSGVVARSFKQEVFSLISNDSEFYSYVLSKNYLQTQKIENSQTYIEMLNALELCKNGLIYRNYCLGSGSRRAYFSDANGQKIDALRQAIESYKEDENTYYFLLASLLESVDKVANTASVYSAFLKTLKPLACKNIVMEPSSFEADEKSHLVFHEDANVLIKKIKGDILYLDPPYNHRQYGANYHILNTIALYDTFTPKGKTGVRNYVSSAYCKGSQALQALEELIKNAEFHYLFLSYNDEGLMGQKDIRQVMQKYGRYDIKEILHQRFKAYDNKFHKATTYEYVHILEKF